MAYGTLKAKMIVAALDIGTNSVKLVVSEDNGKVTLDEVRITRLGEGVDSAGKLGAEASARTLKAVTEFARLADTHGATVRAGVGTSALRDASDGAEFARRASEIFGGPVEIISGEREAELTFLAVSRDPDLPLEASVIASDIGGGSSEVVLGDGEKSSFRTSLQLGAVRLTERTQPSDPWTPEDLARARALADEAVAALPTAALETTFVACGGTAANLAGMALSAPGEGGTLADIHGFVLSAQTLDRQITTLASLPLAQRKSVPGLEPDRAEVIIAGAILQRALLQHFRLDALTVSVRGLRYGLLSSLLQKEN